MPPLWTPSCDSTRDCGLRAYGSQAGASEVQKQACIFACLFVPWMLRWACLFFKAPRVPYGQASSLMTWVETVFVFNTFVATWQTVNCGNPQIARNTGPFQLSCLYATSHLSEQNTETGCWRSPCAPPQVPLPSGAQSCFNLFLSHSRLRAEFSNVHAQTLAHWSH